jgi:cytochrome bd-type quinol oxidase subunit 2
MLAFAASARRLGISSAAGTVFLVVAYGVTLVAGFLSLQSPQQPIGDPLFSILEILIILMMPVMVALMVAVHAWASPDTKAFSLMALVFMSLLAGLTCSLHFVILTVGRQAAFAGLP